MFTEALFSKLSRGNVKNIEWQVQVRISQLLLFTFCAWRIFFLTIDKIISMAWPLARYLLNFWSYKGLR